MVTTYIYRIPKNINIFCAKKPPTKTATLKHAIYHSRLDNNFFPYILGPDTPMCIGFQEVLIVYFFTEDTSDLFQLITMVC